VFSKQLLFKVLQCETAIVGLVKFLPHLIEFCFIELDSVLQLTVAEVLYVIVCPSFEWALSHVRPFVFQINIFLGEK